jgi:hypothetical protein
MRAFSRRSDPVDPVAEGVPLTRRAATPGPFPDGAPGLLAALCLLVATAAPSSAADLVATVKVVPSATPVRTGVFLEEGEWFQLVPSGTWRAFDKLSLVDYRGDPGVSVEGLEGTFMALMFQAGNALPVALVDTVPRQASQPGEILLWCNLGNFPGQWAEGHLEVQVLKGKDLEAVVRKLEREQRELERERQAKIDALLADAEIRQCLQRLNEIRALAGLAPARISVERSAACALHARYLALNWGRPEVEGLKAHEEVETLSGYTPEGKRAGAGSVINYVSPSESVDDWVATFYHRVPLLNPHLAEIGVGYARGGPGWVTLLDCAGVDRGGRSTSPVLFPSPGQADVPRAFHPEIPDPVPEGRADCAGFPLTVSFFGGREIEAASLSLADASGGDVPGWYSDPEHPATFFSQGSTLCFIPAAPLAGGQRYTARVTATVDGRPFAQTWSFTTVRAHEPPRAAVEPDRDGRDALGGVLLGGLLGLFIAWLVLSFLP